jgi:hypothetical protein
MQLLGLGVVALLLPPLLWSLRLIRFHLFDRSALKLVLWVVGIVSTAAVASALPATPRWPLPTGMGGVIGDALLQGTRNIVGLGGTALGGLVAFVFAGIAILSVTAAAGFGFVTDEDPDPDQDEDAAFADGEERRDDEPGLLRDPNRLDRPWRHGAEGRDPAPPAAATAAGLRRRRRDACAAPDRPGPPRAELHRRSGSLPVACRRPRARAPRHEAGAGCPHGL